MNPQPTPTRTQRVEAAIGRVRAALPPWIAEVVVAELRFLDSGSWSPNAERLDRLIGEINRLPVAPPNPSAVNAATPDQLRSAS